MQNTVLNSLTKKIIALVFLAFVISFGVLLLMVYVGTDLLNEYFLLSSYISDSEKPYIEEFQSYVTEKGLVSSDTHDILDWYTWNHPEIEQFTIYRDQKLIYDSRYSLPYYAGKTKIEELNTLWMYAYSVEFADGPVNVFIYANFKRPLYIALYIFIIAFCIILWMVLLVLGIRKRVKYIQLLDRQVTQIRQGDLITPITVKGTDELGSLADGLDHMRQALLDKQNLEAELKEAQNELVLGMAHDLRTPLSGLVGFLEIAGKTKNLPVCQEYVARSYSKTLLLRDLSNQLFDYFLINSKPEMELSEPEPAEYALGEYLSNLVNLLEMEQYTCETTGICWEMALLRICPDYMERIVDNLVSNMKRYADPAFPVVLSVEYEERGTCLILEDHTLQPDPFVKGTGIGMKNVAAMMKQMGGSCEVSRKDGLYRMVLRFPVVS